MLEARIAPATIAGFMYTDSDGDVVQVSFGGTADSVSMLNSLNQEVSISGGDIKTVVLSNPSSSFKLRFADTNPGFGNDVVSLGSFSGPGDARLPAINGIETIENGGNVTYNLAAYKGTGFSSGGGLNILGALTGTSADLDLDLLLLGGGAKIRFRDGFGIGAAGKIAGPISGMFTAGDFAANSALTVGSIINLVKVGNLEATAAVSIEGNLVGRLEVGTTPANPDLNPGVGLVLVKGTIGKSGLVTSPGDINLKVGGELRGLVEAFDDLTVNVGKNITGGTVIAGGDITFSAANILGHASILAGDEVNPSAVTKDIIASNIVGGSGLTLDVGGSVRGSMLGGGTDSVDVDVHSKLVSSQIVAGDNMTVTVGSDVTGTKINSDGDLKITIGANMIRSQIASNSSSVDLTVVGRVMGSQILAADSGVLNVSGEFKGSSFVAGQDITATVARTVSLSEFAAGSNLNFTAGGNVQSSSLLPKNDLSTHIAGNLAGSLLETRDGSSLIEVTGPIVKSTIRSGIDVTIAKAFSIGADVVIDASKNINVTSTGFIAARITAAGNAVVDAGGPFSGAIRTGKNAELVAPSVAIVGTIPKLPLLANSLNPAVPKNGIWVGGNLVLDVAGNVFVPTINVGQDVIDFFVGGNLKATVRVGGNFVSGTSAETAVTVVGGAVLESSFIEVGGNMGGEVLTSSGLEDSAQKLVFVGAIAGRIDVTGKLLTDLQFNAGIGRLSFAGGVGPAVAAADISDKVADIVAAGRIGVLSAGSIFTSSATGGTFTNGAGALTGTVKATIGSIG